jgi:hypothetical protein
MIGWSNTPEAIAAVAVGALAGGSTYLGLLALTRVEELTALLALLPRGDRGRWRGRGRSTDRKRTRDG